MDLIVNDGPFTFIFGHGQKIMVLLNDCDIDPDMSQSSASSELLPLRTYSTVEYFGFSACHNRVLRPE